MIFALHVHTIGGEVGLCYDGRPLNLSDEK